MRFGPCIKRGRRAHLEVGVLVSLSVDVPTFRCLNLAQTRLAQQNTLNSHASPSSNSAYEYEYDTFQLLHLHVLVDRLLFP